MYKTSIIFFIIISMVFCNKKSEDQDFDKNGKLIVYNEDIYALLWINNKKLDVTVIDTFCINQKARAQKDIQMGKLIYYGFHPREFKKMTSILNRFGIETKEHLSRSVIFPGFDPYCYQNEMYDEIKRKFGDNFIDSIFRICQKEFILDNPTVDYIEEGVDLRKLYKVIN